jgi:glycosyltransferase involved in cell wall biosynthesis
MRCLQIVDSYTSVGGVERFVYNFTQLLEEKGFKTLIAAFEVEQGASWGDFQVGTKVMTDDVAGWEQLAAEFSPDIIVWHVQGARSAPVIERLSLSYKISATVHGAMCPSESRLYRDRDEICSKASGMGCYMRWYARQCGSSASPYSAFTAMRNHKKIMSALKACSHLYAISESVASFLHIEGIDKGKISIFINTLTDLVQLPELILPRNRGRIRLLYAGRLVYAKGVQYLIQAVHILRQRGLQAECIIAGEGWYQDKLKQLTEELDLAEHIRFAGKVPGDEIDEWYRECDMTVVPSIWPEPSCLVVPEARRHGKPVVVFEAGGLPEWAGFMDGIFVAKHASADSLADAILSVYDSDARERSRKKKGLERIDLIRDVTGIPVLL